jgi:hypothetical protein
VAVAAPDPEHSAEHAGDERRQHEHEQDTDDQAAVPERLRRPQRTRAGSGGLRPGALEDAQGGVDDLLVELAAPAGEQLPASLGV